MAKMLVFTISNTILVWIFSSWRPIFKLDFNISKHLFSYSIPLLGNQILNYGVRNIDDLLIGKFLGKQELGLYNRSYALMLLPLKNISSVIANVLFPSFSKIQDDKKRIKEIYLKVIQIVSLITFPLMTGLFVLAKPFILIIFGEQWADMISVIKILSILGLIQSIGIFNGVIYLSTGKTLNLFKVEIVSKLFIIGMIIFGLFFTKSIEGVALFYAIGSIIALLPTWYFMGKIIDLKIFEIFKNLAATSILSCLMGLFLSYLNVYFFIEPFNIFVFLLQIGLGIIFYWVLLFLFKITAFKEIQTILAERLKQD